jgi:uncharacterized membrane protein
MEQEASDWILFFGRFHPLVLHLPIGFLVIAFALEVLSRVRRLNQYKAAVGFVLLTGSIFALVSAVLGFMLAQAGDYDQEVLSFHKWFGIGVAVVSWAAYGLLKLAESSPLMDKAYLSMMSLLMIFLALAGHFGGSLTHGSDYLTQYMPNSLRTIAGLPLREKKVVTRITNLEQAAVFNDIIFPILDARCISCHNESKRKGELMMHTVEALKKGGENGPVFIPGNPDKSRMIERIHLPETHDDHMPPKGKSQLTDDQIELLTWWVNEGAPFDKSVAEVNVGTVQPILDALVDPDANKTEVEKLLSSQVRPANEKILADLKKKGIVVRPLANELNWLQANVIAEYHQPGDSLMLSFLSLSEQLTWLNLSETAATDDMLAYLADMKNLTRLHLQNTNITDDGLKHLKGLQYLEYLNLYGTSVTDDGLKELAMLINLKRVYVWQTKVTMEGVAKLRQMLPGVEVDMGMKDTTDLTLNEPKHRVKTSNETLSEKEDKELAKN